MEITSEFGLTKVNVPKEFVGLTLDQAGFTAARDRYGATVVALRRGLEPILSPAKDETMRDGDQLILAGPEDTLERLTRH
jgi:trk system potassium uptake protein TrkA